MLHKFDSFMKEHEIISQLSASRTPQQNEVKERRDRTIIDMVRYMMSFSTLPTSFWGYTLDITGCILNLIPSKSIPLTPMEIWICRKLNFHHVLIQGCLAHVLKPKVDKLKSRIEICKYVRYLKEPRDHLLLQSSLPKSVYKFKYQIFGR